MPITRRRTKNDTDPKVEEIPLPKKGKLEAEDVDEKPDISMIDCEPKRPKRNARKSTLLTSGDFEVSYPGVVKVEEVHDNEAHSSWAGASTPRSNLGERRRGRPKRQRDPDEEIALETFDANNEDAPQLSQATDADLECSSSRIGGEIDVETLSNVGEDVDEALELEGESNELYEDDQPPLLERSGSIKRRVGRPRKYERRDDFRAKLQGMPRREPLTRTVYPSERAVSRREAERFNAFNVKLFDDSLGETEYGDRYATVIPGCLSYLLRKERIIDLLSNKDEMDQIRDEGWLLKKVPRLPPLVTEKACFAFYIDGSHVNAVRELSSDDLRPWSTIEPVEGEPVIKPNVRKHAIRRVNGTFVPSKNDPRTCEMHLVEYSAWLPRLLRLRKKIFYLSRSGHIIGNVLILYDYTTGGDLPTLVHLPHGNDLLRGLQTDDDFARAQMAPVADDDNPFYEDIIQGERGEKFLQVKPMKLGWFNNKRLLLRYLINDPTLLDDAGTLNARVPYLPPLVSKAAVYVHFAPAALVAKHIHHLGDGLSPWATAGAPPTHRVRTVKRGLVQDSHGLFQVTKEDWQTTGLALVETITVLSRCPRLRKRVIFVQRNSSVILGNVCFIYEYIRDGPIPDIIRQNQRFNALERRSRRLDGDDEMEVEDLLEEQLEEAQEYDENDADLEMHADSLDGGWDTQFNDDLSNETSEIAQPFFETVRQLETGHTYLTIRQKRQATNMDTVLDMIANSAFADERGLVNESKPTHPPLVRNARAYAFFVAANAVYPHDINRDDFSPWSGNGTPNNPTSYRTKVRKFGVDNDETSGRFLMVDGDYKGAPYHLVALYSIHPREHRLRKKIFYLMDTASRLVISHVLIVYDYHAEGPIPRISGPYMKRFCRPRSRRPPILSAIPLDSAHDDVSDISESEKESPFANEAQRTEDDLTFVPLDDLEFMNDRNRQLNYLVNKPHLLEQMDCLNANVPLFPPMTNARGAFVYFMDGREVDVRNLTCDGLGPWSENVHMRDGSIMCRRPKSQKVPLALNREGHLRVVRNARSDGAEYVLNVYAASLPRLSRLKKRVVYILKDGVQVGHSMIIYWYSEEGDLPTPVRHGNSTQSEAMFIRLPPSLRDEARKLLNTMSPMDAAKVLSEKSNHPISTRAMYNIRREMRRDEDPLLRLRMRRPEGTRLIPIADMKDETYDFPDPLEQHVKRLNCAVDNDEADWLENSSSRVGVHGIVDDATLHVSHTEEIAGSYSPPHRIRPTPPAFRRDPTSSMNVVMRFARMQFGATSEEETLDLIWRMLLSRNEHRLLHNIRNDLGVEIVAEGELVEPQEEYEAVVEDGAVHMMIDESKALIECDDRDYAEEEEPMVVEHVDVIAQDIVQQHLTETIPI